VPEPNVHSSEGEDTSTYGFFRRSRPTQRKDSILPRVFCPEVFRFVFCRFGSRLGIAQSEGKGSVRGQFGLLRGQLFQVTFRIPALASVRHLQCRKPKKKKNLPWWCISDPVGLAHPSDHGSSILPCSRVQKIQTVRAAPPHHWKPFQQHKSLIGQGISASWASISRIPLKPFFSNEEKENSSMRCFSWKEVPEPHASALPIGNYGVAFPNGFDSNLEQVRPARSSGLVLSPEVLKSSLFFFFLRPRRGLRCGTEKIEREIFSSGLAPAQSEPTSSSRIGKTPRGQIALMANVLAIFTPPPADEFLEPG